MNVDGAVDDTHAALGELRFDPVMTDSLPDHEKKLALEPVGDPSEPSLNTCEP